MSYPQYNPPYQPPVQQYGLTVGQIQEMCANIQHQCRAEKHKKERSLEHDESKLHQLLMNNNPSYLHVLAETIKLHHLIQALHQIDLLCKQVHDYAYEIQQSQGNILYVTNILRTLSTLCYASTYLPELAALYQFRTAMSYYFKQDIGCPPFEYDVALLQLLSQTPHTDQQREAYQTSFCYRYNLPGNIFITMAAYTNPVPTTPQYHYQQPVQTPPQYPYPQDPYSQQPQYSQQQPSYAPQGQYPAQLDQYGRYPGQTGQQPTQPYPYGNYPGQQGQQYPNQQSSYPNSQYPQQSVNPSTYTYQPPPQAANPNTLVPQNAQYGQASHYTYFDPLHNSQQVSQHPQPAQDQYTYQPPQTQPIPFNIADSQLGRIGNPLDNDVNHLSKQMEQTKIKRADSSENLSKVIPAPAAEQVSVSPAFPPPPPPPPIPQAIKINHAANGHLEINLVDLQAVPVAKKQQYIPRWKRDANEDEWNHDLRSLRILGRYLAERNSQSGPKVTMETVRSIQQEIGVMIDQL